MRIDRYLSLLAAAGIALLLTGCLDYEEEMWINNDLSGRAVVKLTLPDSLKEKYASVAEDLSVEKLQKRFNDASGVKLVRYSATDDARKPVITMEVQFSSISALSKALANNAPAAALGGSWDSLKTDGKVTVNRRLGTVTPKLEGNGVVQYVTHFPSDLVYTNTTRHDGSRDTVRYRFSLEEILARQPVMTNAIPSSLPWMWILISAAIIFGGAYFGWNWMEDRRRSRR